MPFVPCLGAALTRNIKIYGPRELQTYTQTQDVNTLHRRQMPHAKTVTGGNEMRLRGNAVKGHIEILHNQEGSFRSLL